MILTCEQACYGLASIIAYHCLGCGEKISFATSTRVSSLEGSHYWTFNLGAFWGKIVTEGGYSDLQVVISSLGVAVMVKRTFIATDKKVGKWWWDLLEESMSAAEREEHELAIQQNHLDNDKGPIITVVVDAGWSKRTYFFFSKLI